MSRHGRPRRRMLAVCSYVDNRPVPLCPSNPKTPQSRSSLSIIPLVAGHIVYPACHGTTAIVGPPNYSQIFRSLPVAPSSLTREIPSLLKLPGLLAIYPISRPPPFPTQSNFREIRYLMTDNILVLSLHVFFSFNLLFDNIELYILNFSSAHKIRQDCIEDVFGTKFATNQHIVDCFYTMLHYFVC